MAKSQTLTHTGCAVGTKIAMPLYSDKKDDDFDVSLYPNPTSSNMHLLVQAPSAKTKPVIKVIDIMGNVKKTFETTANIPLSMGDELNPGIYFVEVTMGNKSKRIRVVKY